jgi:hypothetical protein
VADPKSPNVVRCPNCNKEAGEEECAFIANKTAGENYFDVTHKKCGGKFTIHHREFYRRGGQPPEPKNPFHPVKIATGGW